MIQYQDKDLTCVECNTTFTFSASDQEYFARKGFTNEPKRCKGCREKRKTGGDRGSEPRTMYSVTCDSCGRPTQVPFNPTNGRPVYCRDCYVQQKGQGGGRH
jgi:CxxC-x17-CxxC domain-containing protein